VCNCRGLTCYLLIAVLLSILPKKILTALNPIDKRIDSQFCNTFFYFFCDVSDKDRELGEAHAEIRALKLPERAREKVVDEVIFECSPGLCKPDIYVHHLD
jgi:hypothetical protein